MKTTKKPTWKRCLAVYKSMVFAAKNAPFQITDLNNEGLEVLTYLQELAKNHGHLLRITVYPGLNIVTLSTVNRITGEQL